MSDAIFPLLPGLTWNLTKTPMFNTKVMTSVNGRELRASFQSEPKYNITLAFEFLRQGNGRNELDQIEGFFLERRGAFDSFLLAVPEDDYVDRELLGVADGVRTVFPVFKTRGPHQQSLSHLKQVGAFVDPMWEKDAFSLMWASDGNKLMWSNLPAFTVVDGNLVFVTPPEAGTRIIYSSVFYYRCRFKDDELTFTNFMKNLWEAKKIELVGSLGNKV